PCPRVCRLASCREGFGSGKKARSRPPAQSEASRSNLPMTQTPRLPVLALAGFMGSGKTTIGTLLARQLGWRFVDLDDRIEAAAGITIAQFFERHGEPAFRQLEADQLRAALGRAAELREGTILALGGGTYAQQGCPAFLRARCMTMTGRPLFRDETSFRQLHAQRLPSYRLADFRVDSSGEPAQVVAEILRRGIVAAAGERHLVVDKPRS